MLELAAAVVQEATAVGPLTTVLHVVALKPLPELAAAGLQEAVPVGPVTVFAQVVAT